MSRNGICNFSCSVFYMAVPDCPWTEHFALTTELTSFLLNSYCYKGRKKKPTSVFFAWNICLPNLPKSVSSPSHGVSTHVFSAAIASPLACMLLLASIHSATRGNSLKQIQSTQALVILLNKACILWNMS